MAGEFASVGVVVAVGRKVVSVLLEDSAALVGDDLKAMSCQFQIAHDLWPEKAANVRTVRIEYARRQFSADGGTANPVVFLNNEYVEAGALQIAGVYQTVVTCADHDDVERLRHIRILPFSPTIILAMKALSIVIE